MKLNSIFSMTTHNNIFCMPKGLTRGAIGFCTHVSSLNQSTIKNAPTFTAYI